MEHLAKCTTRSVSPRHVRGKPGSNQSSRVQRGSNNALPQHSARMSELRERDHAEPEPPAFLKCPVAANDAQRSRLRWQLPTSFSANNNLHLGLLNLPRPIAIRLFNRGVELRSQTEGSGCDTMLFSN